MENILKTANKLAALLESSECSLNYKKYKAVVECNPPLFNEIKEFKLLLESYKSKTSHTFEDEKIISKKYFDVLLNDDAKAFLESEKQFSQLMYSVWEIVSASLKVWEELEHLEHMEHREM